MGISLNGLVWLHGSKCLSVGRSPASVDDAGILRATGPISAASIDKGISYPYRQAGSMQPSSIGHRPCCEMARQRSRGQFHLAKTAAHIRHRNHVAFGLGLLIAALLTLVLYRRFRLGKVLTLEASKQSRQGLKVRPPSSIADECYWFFRCVYVAATALSFRAHWC
jgi:hypothetical protein